MTDDTKERNLLLYHPVTCSKTPKGRKEAKTIEVLPCALQALSSQPSGSLGQAALTHACMLWTPLQDKPKGLMSPSVHCSPQAGSTGRYNLLWLTLNRQNNAHMEKVSGSL